MSGSAAQFDLVLKDADILTPNFGSHQKKDVAFHKGRVAAIEDDIVPSRARHCERLPGAIVVPGLVDIHAHVFAGIGGAIDPDVDCLPRGTTTAVDAGTAGANTMDAFARQIPGYRTRVLVWLNLSTIGQADHRVAELTAILHADEDAAVASIERHKDLMVGLKARLSTYVTGGTCLPILRLLLKTAERVDLPVMIHIGDTGESLDQIIALLRKGDIVTHCFTGRRHGIAAPDGKILKSVFIARDRGVLFDTGHGLGNFSFAIARAAIQADFLPDTISTDLTHTTAVNPHFDMSLMATEMLALGMPLAKVIAAMTTNAGRAIGRPELGQLAPGTIGDATVLRLADNPARLTDSTAAVIETAQQLSLVAVVKDGILQSSPQNKTNL